MLVIFLMENATVRVSSIMQVALNMMAHGKVTLNTAMVCSRSKMATLFQVRILALFYYSLLFYIVPCQKPLVYPSKTTGFGGGTPPP